MNLREAQRNAIALMELHGLNAKGWTFQFNRRKTAFGACNYVKRTIELSAFLTETGTPEQVRNTVLHEIAHAMAGKAEEHGPRWKAIHRSIGGNGRSKSVGSAEQFTAMRYKWRATCSRCDRKWHRHKLTQKMQWTAKCPYDRTPLVWQSGSWALDPATIRLNSK